MSVLRRTLARLRAVRHIEWVLLVALLALFVLQMGNSIDDSLQESSELEKRMEAVLECIRGAGEVRVLVNSASTVTTFSNDNAESVIGVLVVAEGADDLLVRMELQRAVQTLLGVELAQIEILDMKEHSP